MLNAFLIGTVLITRTGDVTRGVPSLADLLQSDGETDQIGRDADQGELGTNAEGNITGMVPSLGALLEDEETDQLLEDTAAGEDVAEGAPRAFCRSLEMEHYVKMVGIPCRCGQLTGRLYGCLNAPVL